MALRNILGITVGLAAAFGAAAYGAKKLFGSDESNSSFAGDFGASTGANGAGATGASGTAATPREGLDPTLLEILACPDDKEPVIYQKEGDAERLTCTKCGKRYPVRDGIPVMLIDEAAPGPVPTQDEVEAARKLVSEGKPALVGAGTSAGGSGSSSGNTSSGGSGAGSTSAGGAGQAGGSGAGSAGSTTAGSTGTTGTGSTAAGSTSGSGSASSSSVGSAGSSGAAGGSAAGGSGEHKPNSAS